MNTKIDRIYETMNVKKKQGEPDETERLKAEIEKLRLMMMNQGTVVGPPATVETTVRRLSEEERLRRSKEDADKRIASLEEEVSLLRRLNDNATREAEVWRQEAHRPGNKGGSIAIEETPATHSRIRPRCTLVKSQTSARITMAEAHAREVQALKELRGKDLNDKRVAEQEVEMLKEKLAQLEMERQQQLINGTNLKSKLDEAVGLSARATPGSKQGTVSAAKATKIVDKDGFIADCGKQLKGMKKEGVMAICMQEGVTYSTLEKTKEDIVTRRVAKAFGKQQVSVPTDAIIIEETSEDTRTSSADLAQANGDEEVS
ncbi:hypothetical protein CBR_g49397 [Chara braunii]|uniref:Uncharacterized protein n=1 Tax=Chara braunii TaxID=69332 RepID=A0A388M4U8_CHABU|nr:hypothetical protein CBR_g49397 [Chara braunii]|eukprot:GBG89607.1 hypothetical protein CBR_g49397 [Chara braunii]